MITPVPKSPCDVASDLINQYGWNKDIATAVMKAETKCDSNSVGDTWPIGGVLAPSCGLFQVRTLPGRPTCEQLKDPAFNVAYAYGLYQAHGWSPWSTFNNGNYKAYL